MRRAALGLAAFALIQCGAAWSGETLTGRARVIDGDTLRVRDTVVGLFGVAAPNLGQTCEDKGGRVVPCGREAAQALSEHLGEAVIACETRGLDSAHRTLAVCRLGDEDVNAWMVASGFAVSERFDDATYFRHETKAWAKRRGLWAGVFEDPTGRQRGDYALAAKPAAGEERRSAEGAPALKLSKLGK